MDEIYVHADIEDLEKIKLLFSSIHFVAKETKYLNECGGLDLGSCRVNFLVGKLKTEKCLWCNSNLGFRVIPTHIKDMYECYLECINCHSTGRKKNIYIESIRFDESAKLLKQMFLHDYIQVKSIQSYLNENTIQRPNPTGYMTSYP